MFVYVGSEFECEIKWLDLDSYAIITMAVYNHEESS